MSMTRISTIGRAQMGNTSQLQAELNKLVDYQNLIYQRLLVLAKLRKNIQASYPNALVLYDRLFTGYVDLYNQRIAEIKAKTDATEGVQIPFQALAREFAPSGASVGAIPVVIAIAIIAALAAGTAYTITELQRQNKASETEIKNLDNLLQAFKQLPGANASSLGNLLGKIDYTPGGTTPPDTGITSAIKSLTTGAVVLGGLYFGYQLISKRKSA